MSGKDARGLELNMEFGIKVHVTSSGATEFQTQASLNLEANTTCMVEKTAYTHTHTHGKRETHVAETRTRQKAYVGLVLL